MDEIGIVYVLHKTTYFTHTILYYLSLLKKYPTFAQWTEYWY